MKKLLLTCFSVFLLSACAAQPVVRNFTLQGDHGKLSAVLRAPQGKKKYPVVLILHGFNANKEMPLLTQLAGKLQERGIGSIMFDFNGHGQSEGSFLDMTIPNELEDAKRVYAYAKNLAGVTHLAAVGHSQGGLIAGMLAGEVGEEGLKAVVLLAPAPELKEDTARGDLFGVRFDPNNVPPYITLSNGLKVGRAFLQTTPHVQIYEVSARYTGPVLVLHSQDDRLVPYRYGVEYSNVFPHAQLKTLHGFDHNFTQDPSVVGALAADYLDNQLN